jgi:hypothetical protein
MLRGQEVSMAHQLVLGSLLGGMQPYDLGASYAPATVQAPTYTLTVEEGEDPEVARLRRRLNTSNTVFGVGLVTSGVGVAVTGAGMVILVAGIIPLALGAPEIALTGLVTMAVGVGIVSVAVPVMVGSALVGNVVLRREGVEVSSVPGLVALGGIGLVIAGGALDEEVGGLLATTGLVAIVGGSIGQVYLSNRAFREYERSQEATGGLSLSLHPVAALDGYGLGVTAQW